MGYESPLTTLGNTLLPHWISFNKVGIIDRVSNKTRLIYDYFYLQSFNLFRCMTLAVTTRHFLRVKLTAVRVVCTTLSVDQLIFLIGMANIAVTFKTPQMELSSRASLKTMKSFCSLERACVDHKDW